LIQKTIPFFNEQAYCPFYAVDLAFGLIAVSALTTAQELGLRVAARLVGGQEVLLADGTALRRQKEVEIPLPAPANPAPQPPPLPVRSRKGRRARPVQNEQPDPPATRYKPAYTRTHPLRLETGVGYETVVLHRDATMQTAFGHWGYLLRMPGSSDAHFWARFFHLWGAVTGLPARPAWVQALWGMGLKTELIVPLTAFGCEGWRIDPRRDRPDGVAGWREALKTIALAEREACSA
jgi:hypothetical protein